MKKLISALAVALALTGATVVTSHADPICGPGNWYDYRHAICQPFPVPPPLPGYYPPYYLPPDGSG